MIRPFYRSRLFWLGMPGLVFLIWGWRDSETHYTEFTWASSRSLVGIYQHEGRIGLMVTDVADHPVFFGPQRRFTREVQAPFWAEEISILFGGESYGEARIDPVPGIFRRRWRMLSEIAPGTTGRLHPVPFREWGADFWLVVSGYTALWLGAVAGWHRWKLHSLRRQESPFLGE